MMHDEGQHDGQDPPQARLRARVMALWRQVRWPSLALLALLALALGMAGFIRYHQQQGSAYTWPDALYQSIQLFTLESVEAAPLGAMPWQLQVARFLAPLVSAYAVVQAMALLFGEQISRLMMRLSRGHVIIVGLGGKGALLAQRYRRAGRAVIVIEREAAAPAIEAVRACGARVIIGDGQDEGTLLKAGLGRAAELLAVTGSDGVNIEVALSARRLLEKRRGPAQQRQREELRCLVHIYDRALWTKLRAQEFAPENAGRIMLEFFNIYDSGARLLLDCDSPLAKGVTEPAIAVIGLGCMGESVILHAAYRWYERHQHTGVPLRVVVVDLEAGARLDSLLRRCPLVAHVCQIEALGMDARLLDGQSAAVLSEVSHAYICLDDATTAVTAGLALLEHAGTRTRIWVRMSEDAALAGWLQGMSLVRGEGQIRAFGLLERACQPRLLEDGTHETLARAMHGAYLAEMRAAGIAYDPQSRPALLPWSELPDRYRRSNLSQAEHIGIKLAAIGCAIASWTQPGAEQMVFLDGEIECMAAMEQARWRMEREGWGWRYDPDRNDAERRHPAVLGWDDARLRDEDRAKTRASVARIPYLLSLAGFQVRRVR